MQKRTVAASIEKAVGKAFVYASRDKTFLEAADAIGEIKKRIQHASFGCQECGTKMVADATLKPFCVTCGSHKVSLSEAKTQVGAVTDADLTAVNCNACKMVNVFQHKALEASGNSLHCVACSAPLALATADDATGPAKLGEDNVEPDALHVPDHPETPKASATNTENVETPPGAEPAKLLGTETPDLKVPDQPEAAATEAADADEMPDNDYDDEAVELEMSALEDLEKEDDEDKADEKSDFVSSDDFPEDEALPDAVSLDEDTAEADADLDLDFEADDAGEPLMDSMDMDDSEMALSFVQAAGRLVAMKGPVAIATLTSVRAGANADIMASDTFAEAVSVAAKSKGLRKALTAFGFKPIRVKVLSLAAVNAQKAQLIEKSKADHSTFMKRLEKSLAIAAAGLARNQFKGHKNVLSAALVDEMKLVGMRNAPAMVTRIMATHGVEFAKQLIEMADKLSKMSEESRNAMADVLSMTTETADDVVEDVADDDSIVDDDFDSITSRVKANRVVSSTIPNIKVSASVHDILSGNAKLTFAS
jgi:hypothetical protein